MLEESKDFIWIEHPLSGRSPEYPSDRQIIINWIQEQHDKGFELVGSIERSTFWIFKKRRPNSVEFIKGDI